MSQMIKDIAAHLAKQRQRSVRGSGCVYRTGYTGKMCAVGCLIPDELYTLRMEGRGVRIMLDEFPEVATHIRERYSDVKPHHLVPILVAAQEFHDSGEYSLTLKSLAALPDDELAEVIEHKIEYMVEH